MEKLTQKRVELLDKLFNLSTDESTIICSINNRIDSYNKDEEETKKRKEEYEIERKNLETELLTFSSQAKDFLSAFGKYNNSSFDKLKKVEIDLEIGTIVNKVRKSVPTYEKELNKDIKEQVNGISSCTKKIKEIIHSRDEAKEELAKETDLKERLADLLDDILVNNNIASYTRGFIRKILNELHSFDEEEIKELEYLILFPESGLKLYEEYKANPYTFEEEQKEVTPIVVEKEKEIEIEEPISYGPTLLETYEAIKANKKDEEEVEEHTTSEIIAPTLLETYEAIKSAKIEEPEEVAEEDEEVEEKYTTSEIIAPTLLETYEAIKSAKVEEPEEVTEEDEEVEEAKEYVYNEEENKEEDEDVNKVVEEIQAEDDLKEKLDNIGLDINAVDIVYRDKVLKELNKTEEKLLKNNYELLKGLEVDNECIYEIDENNYMYLTDPELNNKITIVRSKGVKDNTIKNHLQNSGLKMSIDTLGDRIKALSNNKDELKDSNIYMLEIDLVNIENNINKLNDAGIELDEKEKRNYMAILERCNNIDTLINILTTYVVNLSKRNGKFELNILLSNPKELIFALDNLIEKGLEDQIAETPEIFSYNIDRILDRIDYCNQNNIQVYDEDDNLISNYIYDAKEFASNYPDAELKQLISSKEANSIIDQTFNDSYISQLIEILDDYYSTHYEYNIEPENREIYEKLIEAIEKEANITNIGKNTSKLNNTVISKNKLERNLAIITNFADIEKIENNIKKNNYTSSLI